MVVLCLTESLPPKVKYNFFHGQLIILDILNEKKFNKYTIIGQ